MSRPMSMQEWVNLYNHIRKNHPPYSRGGVKYMHPNIDMRTGVVFSINLRGFGWEEFLHTQNECRDLPESLYERVVKMLKEKSDED